MHFYPNETHEQIIKEIEEYIVKVAFADPWLSENPPQFKWGGESMIVDRGEIFPSLEIDSEHTAVKRLAQYMNQFFLKRNFRYVCNGNGWWLV